MTTGQRLPDRPVRVAVDLMGGDHAPDAVVEGALLARAEHPDIEVLLVGPPDLAHAALSRHGAPAALEVVAAGQVVGMAEEPLRAVRAKRDATVRVAARLVREGAAHATVSVGSTGAAVAAAAFTLGRLPGITRPALAVTVPALSGPVVLLDVGAATEADAAALTQFAVVGSVMATLWAGAASPRVGLLSVGSEPGKGDATRTAAFDRLATAPLCFVGNVEGDDVVLGGRADVVVTDGFTGNVMLKAVEGVETVIRRRLAAALADPAPALAALRDPAREGLGGAVLLGVGGVVVVGHGRSSPRAVASCVTLAARAVRDRLVTAVAAAAEGLVSRRRAAAGGSAAVPL